MIKIKKEYVYHRNDIAAAWEQLIVLQKRQWWD